MTPTAPTTGPTTTTIPAPRTHQPWLYAVGKPRNMLSNKKFFRLSQTIMADRDRILADRTPKADLAERYTQTLRFKVSEANVKAVFNVLGLSYTARARTPAAPQPTTPARRGRPSKNTVGMLENRISDLTTMIANQQAQIDAMRLAAQG